MIKESRYLVIWWKNINEELVMTKEDNEDFENSNKCWFCDNGYIDGDVKVRDQGHISGKYRGCTHKHCNINLRLNHKIAIVFHNLLWFSSNGLEKYMSFTINNKLSFIDSFQFISSSLDSLVKN